MTMNEQDILIEGTVNPESESDILNDCLKKGKKNIHNLGVGFEVPFWRVVDIDTPHDWKRAELLFKILNNKFFKINKYA